MGVFDHAARTSALEVGEPAVARADVGEKPAGLVVGRHHREVE
jgi:hypothetical protein